jgi:putative addiction module component (TIGR02574 family)
MTVESLLRQAEELTPAERRELAERLLKQDVPESELSDGMKAELDRRLAAADAAPGAGIPWEIVKAESLKRVRR